MLNVDFSNVSESVDYKRPGAGVYCCRIVDVEHNQDKQYIKAYLDICYGEFKDTGKSVKDRTGQDWGYINTYFSYKPTALGMLKHSLHVVADSSKIEPKTLEKDFNETEGKCLIGKYVGIVIGEQEYKAKDGSIKKTLALPKLVLAADAKDHPEKFEVPALQKLAEDEKPHDVTTGGINGTTVSEDELPF